MRRRLRSGHLVHAQRSVVRLAQEHLHASSGSEGGAACVRHRTACCQLGHGACPAEHAAPGGMDLPLTCARGRERAVLPGLACMVVLGPPTATRLSMQCSQVMSCGSLHQAHAP